MLQEVLGPAQGLLQALEDGTKDIEFPLDTVSEARLVLNEALIREALKAGKS